MNRNFIFIGLILGIILIVGCVQQTNKIKVPSSPAKLDASGAPSEPSDQALAEITFLSHTGEEWEIRIDKIRDYIRYPAAANPQLNTGDAISIRFNGWIDTFQSDDKECPAGYIKSPKPGKTTPTGTPDTRTVPKITVGDKYLAKLIGCFAEIGGFTCPNEKSGWSSMLYNPFPNVVEYECVKAGTPPSIKPVEPQKS